MQIHEAFTELGLDQINHFIRRPNKAVQFCRIDRNGAKWAANHGGMYDSLFYPLLKALVARQKEAAPRNGPNEYRYAWFFYPIVVIRGKLFEIDSTSPDKTPVEVPHVPFIRELKSKALEGRFLVDFVNEDHLDVFVNDVVRTNERRILTLLENDKEALLSKVRPWREPPQD